MSHETPKQVLASIVDGINSGDLDSLMRLYESEAAFATQPGTLNHGLPGVREALAGFIAMKGTLDLEVTRVLKASELALVIGRWSFTGTGPDGTPVNLTGHMPMSCVVRKTGLTFGRSTEGRVLVVSHLDLDEDHIRIISARRATRTEAHDYQENS